MTPVKKSLHFVCFFIYFFWLLAPRPPSKVQTFLFCTFMHIWIDIGEKHGEQLGVLLIIILKIGDFKVDNNVLWNAQNTTVRTIFLHFFFRVSMPPEPPSTKVNPHNYRASYTQVCNSLSS